MESVTTNITSFSEQILTKILSYLNVRDQLKCKVVCKQWLSIISTDKIFHKTRRIHLGRCLLSNDLPPISVFKNSPRKFETLVISQFIEILDDCDYNQLWEEITENIQKVRFIYLNDRMSMHQTLKKMFGKDCTIKLFFPLLKHIIFKGKVKRYKDVKAIIEEFDCSSNNIGLKIKTPFFGELVKNGLVKEYGQLIEGIKLPCHFYNDDMYLLNTGIPLKTLEIIIQEDTYEKCNKLFENSCHLKKLRVWYEINYIPKIIPSRVTYVSFYFDANNVNSFETSLNQIKNVFEQIKTSVRISIEFENNYRKCVSIHAPTQSTLKFEIERLSCPQCMFALTLSGGVVREFISENTIKISEWAKLLDYSPEQEMNLQGNNENFQGNENALVQKMTNLQVEEFVSTAKHALELQLRKICYRTVTASIPDISEAVLLRFLTKYNNIEILTLDMLGMVNYNFSFEPICANLTRLKNLTISISEVHVENVLKNVTEYSKALRKLSIQTITRGRSKIYGVITDIFSKLLSFNVLSVDFHTVALCDYQMLLKGVKLARCELCDETNQVTVKYCNHEHHQILFKFVVPKDLLNQLKSTEVSAF